MLPNIKKKIAEGLKSSPVKIRSAIMYGSWARGKYTEDSDIDVLLVSDEINPRRHKRGREIAAIKQRLSLDLPVDLLLMTTNECLSNFRNHNPLFLDIAWEGIILLDDAGFLKSLMQDTMAYISDKNLEKLEDGWKFPVADRTPTYLSAVSNKDFAGAMLTDGEND